MWSEITLHLDRPEMIASAKRLFFAGESRANDARAEAFSALVRELQSQGYKTYSLTLSRFHVFPHGEPGALKKWGRFLKLVPLHVDRFQDLLALFRIYLNLEVSDADFKVMAHASWRSLFFILIGVRICRCPEFVSYCVAQSRPLETARQIVGIQARFCEISEILKPYQKLSEAERFALYLMMENECSRGRRDWSRRWGELPPFPDFTEFNRMLRNLFRVHNRICNRPASLRSPVSLINVPIRMLRGAYNRDFLERELGPGDWE